MVLPPVTDNNQNNDPQTEAPQFFTGSVESGGGFFVEQEPLVISETLPKKETLKSPEKGETLKQPEQVPEKPKEEQPKVETISSIAKDPNVKNKTTTKPLLHPLKNTTDKLTTLADQEEEEFIENVIAHEHR